METVTSTVSKVTTVTAMANFLNDTTLTQMAYNTIASEASEPKLNVETSSSLLVVLGILLGLSVVILITLTIGWMWTCWTMKRNYKTKERL